MSGTLGDGAVDLSNCDSEPIHVPGAIQPHGVLLSLGGTDLTVAQVSENVERHLGRPARDVLGAPISGLSGPEPAAAVAGALRGSVPAEANPIPFSIRGTVYDGIVHRHEGVGVLELEPRAPEPGGHGGHSSLQKALAYLQRAEDLDTLARMAVEAIRGMVGFDRIMLYRFDEEGHGSVVAESKRADLAPYLGLHYPASDIPRQARELYLRNWIRNIPDARYTPARILPPLHPETGRPLDLTFSVLRSVSPIHLEYLANMGVRAAMSISLVVRGRLWGLISCAHHSGPWFVGHEARAACEAIGRLVSLQLAALEERKRITVREARRTTLDEVAGAMAAAPEDGDLLDTLTSRPNALLSLVGAGGAAVHGAGGLRTCGAVPPAALVADLARWLDERGEQGPFATDALAHHFPAAAEVREAAAGLLTIALPGTPRRRVLWFRPERVHTVFWGGDPRKPVEADHQTRLHPRRSFEKWKEEVQLRAQPWTAADLDTAEELRRRAVEIDLDRQLARAYRAVRVRDDLVAVVSHDLRNPLNVIQMQVTSLLRSADPDRPDRTGRLTHPAQRIQRAADRMNALVSDLLDLARIEAGRFELHRTRQDVRDLVEEAIGMVRPLAEAKTVTLVGPQGGPARAEVDRERIFQVLSNIVGNAIKFTPEGGRITVEVRRRGGEVWISTSDTGPGLPDQALSRVFDRYWQEAGRPRQTAGTGLGLYIAKGIVEAHGGRIWAEHAEGGGARFTFALPCAE